jgi:hypothetical protein
MTQSLALESLTICSRERNKINNPYFSKWNDVVINSVTDRNIQENNDYFGKDLILLNECENHVKKYSKPLNFETIVVLTHPLYLFLSDGSELNFIQKYSAKRYFNNLATLFENKSSIKANIVVFETLHHYADSTSKLLEEGWVDRVFFTQFDTGVPNDLSYKHFLKNKRLFFGGGYNNRCLSSTFRGVTNNVDCVSAGSIRGLILDSPQTSLFLGCRNIGYQNHFNPKKNISLDNLLKDFKKEGLE